MEYSTTDTLCKLNAYVPSTNHITKPGRVINLNLDTVDAKNRRRQDTKRRSYKHIAKFCNAVCGDF